MLHNKNVWLTSHFKRIYKFSFLEEVEGAVEGRGAGEGVLGPEARLQALLEPVHELGVRVSEDGDGLAEPEAEQAHHHLVLHRVNLLQLTKRRRPKIKTNAPPPKKKSKF